MLPSRCDQLPCMNIAVTAVRSQPWPTGWQEPSTSHGW